MYVYHLSDDTNHDDVMTEQVLCGIIESQSKVIESGRLLLWVDNCSTQYKSGYVFKIFLKLAQKYNVRIDFFYGEAGHGRGLVDAMARFGCKGPQNQSWQRTSGIALLMKWWNISKRNFVAILLIATGFEQFNLYKVIERLKATENMMDDSGEHAILKSESYIVGQWFSYQNEGRKYAQYAEARKTAVAKIHMEEIMSTDVELDDKYWMEIV